MSILIYKIRWWYLVELKFNIIVVSGFFMYYVLIKRKIRKLGREFMLKLGKDNKRIGL